MRLALGRPAAGKTGTTTENKAVWFDGFTPQLAAAVGIYNDVNGKPKPMQNIAGFGELTGGTFPVKIWTAFMEGALKGTKTVDFPSRTGVGDNQVPTPTTTSSTHVGDLHHVGAVDVLQQLEHHDVQQPDQLEQHHEPEHRQQRDVDAEAVAEQHHERAEAEELTDVEAPGRARADHGSRPGAGSQVAAVPHGHGGRDGYGGRAGRGELVCEPCRPPLSPSPRRAARTPWSPPPARSSVARSAGTPRWGRATPGPGRSWRPCSRRRPASSWRSASPRRPTA